MAFRVEIAPQAVVNSLVGLSGITWASDSKGFYAGVAADAGSDLIHGGKLALWTTRSTVTSGCQGGRFEGWDWKELSGGRTRG